jgi:two-component system, NarL family, response regulator DesR
MNLGSEETRVRTTLITSSARTRIAKPSGARGFMIKDRPVPELADAVRRAVAGELVIDPNLAVSALEIAANPLSEREREVLRASAGGPTISAIAGERQHRTELPLPGHTEDGGADPRGGLRHRPEQGLDLAHRGRRRLPCCGSGVK